MLLCGGPDTVVDQLRRVHDDLGAGVVSLNFAGFAQLMGADAILSRPQRLVRRALRATHGRFQLERLMAFCSKFGPQWQPRYLLFESMLALPRTALATLWAEGQLPKPGLPRAAPPSVPVPVCPDNRDTCRIGTAGKR